MYLPVARAFKATFLQSSGKISSLQWILLKYIAEECTERGGVRVACIELIAVGSGTMVVRRGDDAIEEVEPWTIAKSCLAQPEVKFTGESAVLFIRSFC